MKWQKRDKYGPVDDVKILYSSIIWNFVQGPEYDLSLMAYKLIIVIDWYQPRLLKIIQDPPM